MRTVRVLKKDEWTPLTISGRISNSVSGRELLGEKTGFDNSVFISV